LANIDLQWELQPAVTTAATIAGASAALGIPAFDTKVRHLTVARQMQKFRTENIISFGVMTVLCKNSPAAAVAAQATKWSDQGLPLLQWGEGPKQKASRGQHNSQDLL
jgi:hypothetical protein